MREGWYPCPSGQPQLRYWTGSAWTEQTRPDLVSWVHGDRVLDVPGVFAFGRSADETAGFRPGPLEPHIWRRARLALWLLVPIWLASVLPMGLLLSYIGLPDAAALNVLIVAVAVGAYGRWHIVLRWLWLRYRPEPPKPAPVPKPRPDLWADLRSAGFLDAARRLDEEVATGELSDVDYVRVARVVQRTARQDGPQQLAPIAVAIQEKGGGAFLHSSGQRDLPMPRLVQHDLVTGQARLGVAAESDRNPATHQKEWFALDTEVLRTSMLVVGPPGRSSSCSACRRS
jgi:hypothetical protein